MALRRRAPASYAERTYNSPIRLVRYAHRRRYELILKAALLGDPQRVLDYGCGEGEMLLSMLSDPSCPSTTRAIAFESWWTANLTRRLEQHPDRDLVGRIEVQTSEDDVPTGSCDVVACGGVLEHITLAQRYRFYEFAKRILRPGGHVVIDVPVELGPALLVKTFGRRVLKSYDREYSMGELLKASVGFKVFDPRRFDPRGTDEFFVSHKGFDYRLLEQEMRAWGFWIERTAASPVTWLPAMLANQEVVIVASLPAQVTSMIGRAQAASRTHSRARSLPRWAAAVAAATVGVMGVSATTWALVHSTSGHSNAPIHTPSVPTGNAELPRSTPTSTGAGQAVGNTGSNGGAASTSAGTPAGAGQSASAVVGTPLVTIPGLVDPTVTVPSTPPTSEVCVPSPPTTVTTTLPCTVRSG